MRDTGSWCGVEGEMAVSFADRFSVSFLVLYILYSPSVFLAGLGFVMSSSLTSTHTFRSTLFHRVYFKCTRQAVTLL